MYNTLYMYKLIKIHLSSSKFCVTVSGRSVGIWREPFSFFVQCSTDPDVTQLVQEEAVVVARGFLQPAAQRSRKTLRGPEVRDKARQEAAGRHVGPH